MSEMKEYFTYTAKGKSLLAEDHTHEETKEVDRSLPKAPYWNPGPEGTQLDSSYIFDTTPIRILEVPYLSSTLKGVFKSITHFKKLKALPRPEFIELTDEELKEAAKAFREPHNQKREDRYEPTIRSPKPKEVKP